MTYFDDLDLYWSTRDQFIQDFKKTRPELSSDMIHGLLLHAAIVLKRTEIIEFILSQSFKENILAVVDKSNYSPISQVLDSGDERLLKLTEDYINKTTIPKVNLHHEDLLNLKTTFKWPQFEDFNPVGFYNKYLVPLYTEESLKEMKELVEFLADAESTYS